MMIVMAISAKGASVYKPGMASEILFPIDLDEGSY